MAAVKTKLGRIACDGCGYPVVLKENEHGTLTVQCDECDVSAFAKRGTAAAARWRSKLPAAALAVIAAAPKTVKKTAAAPVPESVPKATAQEAGAFDWLQKL